ncbi:hypothetical protein FRC01_007200, partial [Tulasnella sp. 417]
MSWVQSCLRRRRQKSSKTLEDLPVEIILNILEIADSIPTLRSTSFVSRRLHDVANSLLYRHVELRHVHRAVFLLSTLVESPELGRHVRSFDCSALPTRCHFPDFVAHSFDLRTGELPVRALRKAVGLTSLVVSVNVADLNAGGWVKLLKGPIELRKLSLCGRNLAYGETVDGSKRKEWTQMIADVLKAQPSIAELEIQGVEPYDSLPRLDPTDLPNLRTLTASTVSAVLLVLRGGHRSLRSLTLGDDISMKQVQDIIFDLIPNGAGVEEFTWRGPTSKRLSYPTRDHWSDASAFLSEVAVKFPN